MKNNYLSYGLTIALFAAISGLLLSLVNGYTAPLIKQQKITQELQSQKEVLPAATTFKEINVNGFGYLEGKDQNNNNVGYVIKALGNGYSSTIQTIVGLDNDFKIIGMKIISQQETPGLGTRVTEIKKDDKKPWFQKQFLNKTLGRLNLTKENGDIVAITGATISSKAVVNSVRIKIKNLIDTVANKPIERNSAPMLDKTNTTYN